VSTLVYVVVVAVNLEPQMEGGPPTTDGPPGSLLTLPARSAKETSRW
jgi:hypothetical protein